jgi:hypothetical protein
MARYRLHGVVILAVTLLLGGSAFSQGNSGKLAPIRGLSEAK